MMAPTHGLASVALAAALLPGGPEYAGPAVLAAAFLGGVAPDADAFAAHRRTLHYPAGYSVFATCLVAAHALVPSRPLLLVCVAVGSAAVHSLSDVLAGGVEREPWNPTSDRAVYNHLAGRWHRPRRYVRYSGAPEDLALAAACAVVAVVAPSTGPLADHGLVALVALAGAYTAVRSPSCRLGERLPRSLVARLPSVRVEETEDGATTVSIRLRRR